MHKHLLLGLVALAAQAIAAPHADWKIYGAVDAQGNEYLLYYDASSIQRDTQDTLRVWTRAVLRSEYEEAIREEHMRDAISDQAKKLIAAGYKPPYSQISPGLPPSDIVSVVMEEQAADKVRLETTVKALYEFDCHGSKHRSLKTYVNTGPVPGADETPTPWESVRPKTTVGVLVNWLCRQPRS